MNNRILKRLSKYTMNIVDPINTKKTSNISNELYSYLFNNCFLVKSIYNINEIENYIKEHKHLINTLTDNGYSIIASTIYHDKYDIFEVLIKYGADLNCRYGEYKYTPLMYAMYLSQDFPRYNYVFMLIKYTNDLEVRDTCGHTALLMAIKSRLQFRVKIISDLLDYGADIYAQNVLEHNILYITILKNDYEVLNFLIEKKMDLNTLNSKNQNILHQIISDRDLARDMLKLLLEYGVKFNEIDNDGKTPFDILVSDLTDHDENVDDPNDIWDLYGKNFYKHYDFFNRVVILFEFGASFCVNNKLLDKLLKIAIHHRNIKYIKILFDHGAKLYDYEDLLYWCTLHCLYNKNIDCLKLLFKYGIKVYVSYDMVIYCSITGIQFPNILKFILENDLCPNIPSSYKKKYFQLTE